MTPIPKEKAKELFESMKGFRVKHSHSIKCALRCVDEIISLMIKFHGRHIEDNIVEIEYWQEVRKEIVNLKSE